MNKNILNKLKEIQISYTLDKTAGFWEDWGRGISGGARELWRPVDYWGKQVIGEGRGISRRIIDWPGSMWRKYIWDSDPRKMAKFERWLGGDDSLYMGTTTTADGRTMLTFDENNSGDRIKGYTYDATTGKWVNEQSLLAAQRRVEQRKASARRHRQYHEIARKNGVSAADAERAYINRQFSEVDARNKQNLSKAQAEWKNIE